MSYNHVSMAVQTEWKAREEDMGRVCVLTPHSDFLPLNSKERGELNSRGGARTNKEFVPVTFGSVTPECRCSLIVL